jgi:hypothetical protein
MFLALYNRVKSYSLPPYTCFFISCNEKEENNEQKLKKLIEDNKDNYLVEDL